jgi:hypothetical protein
LKTLLILLLVVVAPVWAQERSRPVAEMSNEQRADYRKLLRGYVDSFRILGRSRICRLDFDAEPMFREVARRHGEKSEPAAIARLAYAAGAENLMLDRELDPAPPAPMPCDVMIYMRGMRLPELPESLVPRDDRPVR